MPVYTEKTIDKKTGKSIDKLVDGKKQYYIRTYVEEEFGKSKQLTRHNKAWLGKDGKDEAIRVECQLKNTIILNKKKDNKITLHDLKVLYLEYLKGKIDDDTLSWKYTKLNHFCEHDETNQVITYPNNYISSFNRDKYCIWKNQMKQKMYFRGKNKFYYTPKTLSTIHNTVCSMLDFAVNEGFLTNNFAKQSGKMGTPKELKMMGLKKAIFETLTYDEYLSLLDASKDDLKYSTYFDLSFTRGPRIGEIRGFRCCDYNEIAKQLMVNHTMSKKNILKEPKTASSKDFINLNDDVNRKISLLIKKLKLLSEYNDNWFIFGGVNPISEHALTNAKDKYFKIAGIKKHLRPHDFRHSCATWLFSIGIPITVISKILRHANINETMKTYTHLMIEDYKCALSKINSYRKV